MIRNSAVLAVVATLSLTAFAPSGHAQERREGREGRGNPAQMLRSSPLFTALDADKDGELSAKEIAGAPASLKSLDKKGAGKLSTEDLLGAPREGAAPGGSSAADTVARIMAFDKDGDGKLTRAELPERMHGLIERGDSDKDGILTRAELTQLTEKETANNRPGGPEGGRRNGGPGGRGRMMPLLQALDADQNGELSADEIKGSSEALKKLDKNSDGKIAEDELRPQFGGRGRPGRGGEDGGRGERRPEGQDQPGRGEPRRPRSPEPR